MVTDQYINHGYRCTKSSPQTINVYIHNPLIKSNTVRQCSSKIFRFDWIECCLSFYWTNIVSCFSDYETQCKLHNGPSCLSDLLKQNYVYTNCKQFSITTVNPDLKHNLNNSLAVHGNTNSDYQIHMFFWKWMSC